MCVCVREHCAPVLSSRLCNGQSGGVGAEKNWWKTTIGAPEVATVGIKLNYSRQIDTLLYTPVPTDLSSVECCFHTRMTICCTPCASCTRVPRPCAVMHGGVQRCAEALWSSDGHKWQGETPPYIAGAIGVRYVASYRCSAARCDTAHRPLPLCSRDVLASPARRRRLLPAAPRATGAPHVAAVHTCVIDGANDAAAAPVALSTAGASAATRRDSASETRAQWAQARAPGGAVQTIFVSTAPA